MPSASPNQPGVFVGFRIDEELAQVGAVEAVGRTGDVSVTVTIDGTTLVAGQITADVTTMVSDETRGEDSIADALDSTVYPTATFTLTDPVELGSDFSDGQVVQVDATGTMEIRGATQTITVPLQVVSQDDVVVVTGSTDITFSDYGVDPPSAPIVVSLADTGTLELQLFLTSSSRVLTREQILEAVWDYGFTSNASVLDTYISYLRHKVDAHQRPLSRRFAAWDTPSANRAVSDG